MDGQRETVNGAVGGHDGGAPGFHCFFEGRKEDFTYLSFRTFGIIGITGTGGLTVAKIMLGTGKNMIRVRQIIPLISPDNGCRHFTCKHRVLAKGLIHTAPAGIAGKTENRGKGPVQAVCGYLACGDFTHDVRGFGIPAAGSGQLRGEDCGMRIETMTMDGINSENDGNVQACVQRSFLDFLGILAKNMEKGACSELCPAKRFLATNIGVGDLDHLSDFFLSGHLSKKGLCFLNGSLTIH